MFETRIINLILVIYEIQILLIQPVKPVIT